MKPVCREFLKGGALSIDKLIEERACPHVLSSMLNKVAKMSYVTNLSDCSSAPNNSPL